MSSPHPIVDPTLAKLRAGTLTGITRLDLAAGLNHFPDEIFNLADSLEVLNLSGNQLSELPDNLPSLHKLRILFCSENQFTHLPAVLGRCPQLSMIGFKANRISRVPPDAFPPNLRWLILTDNLIPEIPASIGDCPLLQKLMLAGNQLRSLPRELSLCTNLELIRLAANRLTELPQWLLSLPRLAWLAASGNPIRNARFLPTPPSIAIPWANLEKQNTLGEGASGVILRANWKNEPVAVKLYKGSVTSDGLPEKELEAFLAAGQHPQLIPLIGTITHHPEDAAGIVMRLLPETCSILAHPPSLESCTRDIYPTQRQFCPSDVLSIAVKISDVAEHLHRRGILHGDLYAHNIAWSPEGDCFLNDFGAATRYPTEDAAQAEALQRLDVLAFGHLLGELLTKCGDETPAAIQGLQQRCVSPIPAARPLFSEIRATLNDLEIELLPVG